MNNLFASRSMDLADRVKIDSNTGAVNLAEYEIDA